MAQKPTAKKTVAEDPRYTQALQGYEAGLRAMQEHKFDKAKPHFQKVIAGPIKELVDRANVHLSICNQHLERSAATQFKSPEEHFDYAVSLMNIGDYVTAREHLEKLLKQNAKSDYVVYGLAALDCLTGHVEDSLRHLDEALRGGRFPVDSIVSTVVPLDQAGEALKAWSDDPGAFTKVQISFD